jgi:hypothetical protein
MISGPSKGYQEDNIEYHSAKCRVIIFYGHRRFLEEAIFEVRAE